MLDHNRMLLPGLILVALLGGCATAPGVQLYPGPQRANTEVATIWGLIHSIDGRVVRDQAGPSSDFEMRGFTFFEVLPGRHTIVFKSDYPHAARWLPEYTVEFEPKPGHFYHAGFRHAGRARPEISEYATLGEFSGGPGRPVGRVIGNAEKFPESTEGQSPTWKVQLVASARTKSSTQTAGIPNPGESTIVWVDRTLGFGRVKGLAGPGSPPTYILDVALRFQYVGPVGEVPAPGAWLIGGGERVIRRLGVIGVTMAAQASSTDAFGESPLRKWLTSGRDSPETHRLRSGETFFTDFPEAVWRYYFQVSDSISPDQLRLAFADVPPLRLPNVTFAD